MRRCTWAEGDALLRRYHDKEWGVPEYLSRKLWGRLILDGFQAGLSWTTILQKREAFRRAFQGFDPHRVARYGSRDVRRLLGDVGIIRSRSKIESAIGNARAYLAMKGGGEDFSEFAWSFVGGKPIQNTGAIPAKTSESEALSEALKSRGFKFVGPVIVYAWMQANGLVNDHTAGCFRREAVAHLGRA